MKEAINGYKKLGVLLAALIGLPLTDVPAVWVPWIGGIVIAYLIVQGAIDCVKAWKGGK